MLTLAARFFLGSLVAEAVVVFGGGVNDPACFCVGELMGCVFKRNVRNLASFFAFYLFQCHKTQRGAELEWILLAARRKKAGVTRQTEGRKAFDRSQLSFVGVRWSEKQREEEEDERLRWASKWATALQQGGNTPARTSTTGPGIGRRNGLPTAVAVLLKDGLTRSDASLAPPCPSCINPLQNGSVPGTDPSQNPH